MAGGGLWQVKIVGTNIIFITVLDLNCKLSPTGTQRFTGKCKNMKSAAKRGKIACRKFAYFSSFPTFITYKINEAKNIIPRTPMSLISLLRSKFNGYLLQSISFQFPVSIFLWTHTLKCDVYQIIFNLYRQEVYSMLHTNVEMLP